MRNPFKVIAKQTPNAQAYGDNKLPAFSEENTYRVMGTGVNIDGKDAYFAPGISAATLASRRITQADIAQAQTLLPLGVYNPQFGWPDDWAFYWDYIQTRANCPEASFMVKLYVNLVWKNGFNLIVADKKDTKLKEKFMELWNNKKLEAKFKEMTHDAIVYGNGYCESNDNSRATWTNNQSAPTAVGAAQLAAARTLIKWVPATEFYGLKKLDPRTMRVIKNPSMFNKKLAEIETDAYIQRAWEQNISSIEAGLSAAYTDIYLHREQIYQLKFNNMAGGIYGYSSFKEVYYTLKAYLLMIQYLPAIVQKRADVRLQLKYGGNMKQSGVEDTIFAPADGFQKWKAQMTALPPTSDIYTDIFTTIEQIYKNEGQIRGIAELINIWKERVLLGLGVPSSLLDPQGNNQGEIKWGGLKFEVLTNNVKAHQQAIEDLINEQLIKQWIGPGLEFRFKPIVTADLTALTRPLLELFMAGVIDAETVREQLQLPEDAAEGTLYEGNTKPTLRDSSNVAGTQAESWATEIKDGKTILTRVS